MVNVDLRQLCNKLNFYCTNTLNNAAGLCVSRTNYEITIEHWLIKMLESRDGDLPALLDNKQEEEMSAITATAATFWLDMIVNQAQPGSARPMTQLRRSPQ